ncbi:MAG: nitrite/sulfite reductase [Myxococcaceae bacterium]
MSTLFDQPRPRKSFGDAAEAAEFVGMLEKFERGEITSDQYRHYRLSRGIYGQRQDGLHMVRVKIPQGIITAPQLRILADLGERYSRGYGHLTTRQNIQFHNVKPENAPPFMEALANCGLTTREACSHTVRNVVGCPYSGVDPDEPFDVTPYGEAVTRHFLRNKWGSGLPRKFKITISGCPDDCARSAMNDIGIIAQLKDGVRGFRILVGGGTSTLPRSARVIHEFLPADDLLASCEAVVRVFNVEGERNNLRKARLKWAIERLGWEGFKARYEEELVNIRLDGGRPLPPIPGPEQPPPKRPILRTDGRPLPRDYQEWRTNNVRAQLQKGYFAATVFLRLGDISGDQFRGIAKIAEELGDGTVRTTLQQNLLFRWVPEEALPVLWSRLQELGLGEGHADSLRDVVSCPGAETCKIAVTASRGLAQLLGDHFKEKPLGNASTADIKISGCPNGCGQHHISAIGLQGGVKKVGGNLVPQYHLMIGGAVDGTGAKFGRLVARLPARRVPEAVDRLLAHFEKHRGPDEKPHAFFLRLATDEARKLVADLEKIDEKNARPEDFIDLGSDVQFKVVLTESECAA